MDYKAEFAKAQSQWSYKNDFAQAQAEWNSKKKETTNDYNASLNATNAPQPVKQESFAKPSITVTPAVLQAANAMPYAPPTVPQPVLTPAAQQPAYGYTNPEPIAPDSDRGDIELTNFTTAAPTSAGIAAQVNPAKENEVPEQAPRPPANPSKSKSSLSKADSKKWPCSTITTVIYKPGPGEINEGKGLGITFAEHKGKVTIGNIDKNGLGHPTELHKGMVVLSINNQRDFLKSAQATQQYVDQVEKSALHQKAGTALLGIVAMHPLGFIPICITSPQTPLQLGLGFGSAKEQNKKKNTTTPIVVITHVQPGSLADEQTPLQEGMIVKAIHHKKCGPGMTLKQAYDAIYHGKQVQKDGVVKLLVLPPNSYSRNAQTQILDTGCKAPPPTPKKSTENLPQDGYWFQIHYFGMRDVALVPSKVALSFFGATNTKKRKGVKSLYIADGQAYNEKGRVVGKESKFVSV